MDIGGKSEGQIPLSEFGEVLPVKGQKFEVFYEGEDSVDNTALLSKRRADRLRAWERVSGKYHEGDEIQGVVVRKIKGGLLVDIGVNVFLPASQVNLRRTHDITDFVDEAIRKIIKIDERMNIVVSRRKLLEESASASRRSCSRRSRRARSARASSRTSPTSACSSTWAASTACCTSPT
jgi:small subunit ribosomal protein S1